MSVGSLGSLVVLVGLIAPHQSPAPVPMLPSPGTYLGLLFAPSTSAGFNAGNPAPAGVVVTQVLPGSPAAKAGLTRNDFLQRYDGQDISGCEQLARLIQSDKPGRAVKLQVLRAGQVVVCEATLTVGPATCLASESHSMDTTTGSAPARTKPAGPALSANIEPQADGRLRIDLQYYLEGTGRLHTRTLTGNLSELQKQVGEFPDAERRLAQVLLDRLKQLDPAPVRPRP
jgi:hypothetical protein